MKRALSMLAALLAWLGLATMAQADAIGDFYKGKTIRLIVATPPGGPYDNHARLLARHLSDHIPGHPTIVVENLAGGTGMLAANYVYNIGPQDGTVLGNLHNMLALIKALGQSDLKVDPARFNWIGNMTREVGDVIVSTKSPVKTIDDAKHATAVIGAPGSMALGTIYPRVMNYVLGTKFKVVTGYDGAAGVEHALEQGEVDGDAGDTWFSGQGNTYDWYKAGKIRVLVQIGTRTPDLPDVPLLVDLASNKDDRALLELFSSPYTVGKPTAVGPKVPTERVAALRAAYAATMQDPGFLADAKKLGADIEPVSGEELATLMGRLANLPPAMLGRAKQAIAPSP
jgi:tripartite-type tricarboxylate transporter receptor subunit TctC